VRALQASLAGAFAGVSHISGDRYDWALNDLRQ
jgi:hypothetical protein